MYKIDKIDDDLKQKTNFNFFFQMSVFKSTNKSVWDLHPPFLQLGTFVLFLCIFCILQILFSADFQGKMGGKTMKGSGKLKE